MIWLTLFAILTIIGIIVFSSAAEKDLQVVIWPEYFDASLPKNRGRRVPKKLAVQSPTVEDIAKAAKRLKLDPKIEKNKAFPGRWWRSTGRVLVKPRWPKTKIIRQIAKILKK